MDEQELERRRHQSAGHISVPDRPLQQGSARWLGAGWLGRAGAAAMTAAVLAGILVAGQQLVLWRGSGVVAPSSIATSTGPVSPTPNPSPTATFTPTPSAPPLPVSFDRVVFGYRIQLPDGFRNSDCLSGIGGKDGRLGTDTFTLLSPQQERAKDLAHVARGGEPVMWTFQVTLYRADGMSAVELAQRGGCPTCDLDTAARLGSTVGPIVLGGYEAARVMIADEVLKVVVRVNERLYVIELYFDANFSDRVPRPTILPVGVLDAVARTLRVQSPGSIPTPTPVPSIVPPSVSEAAVQLGHALGASDTAGLTGLVTPRCWLYLSFPDAGPTGRAVDAYIAELPQRFAAGLRVTVDPTVRVAQEAGPGGGSYFVGSDWVEAGRTTHADLYLQEVEGRWFWSGSQFRTPGR